MKSLMAPWKPKLKDTVETRVEKREFNNSETNGIASQAFSQTPDVQDQQKTFLLQKTSTNPIPVT